LDQIEAFVARARAAGVEVRYQLSPHLFHDWQLQAELLPEGARAVDEVAAFLVERLAAYRAGGGRPAYSGRSSASSLSSAEASASSASGSAAIEAAPSALDGGSSTPMW